MHQSNLPSAATTPAFPPLESLYWHRFKLTYEVQCAGRLPYYKASAIRGAWGHALRTHSPHWYHRVFEVKAPADHPWAKRFHNVPSPYILSVPSRAREWQAGQQLSVYLTLIGEAVHGFPELLRSLERLGGRGIGRDSLPLCLKDLDPYRPCTGLDSVQTYLQEPPEQLWVHLRFLTPFHLKNLDLDAPAFPDLTAVIRSTAERSALLAHFYCAAPLTLDYEPWLAMAREANLHGLRLNWTNLYSRYSSRSEQLMDVAGWLGHLAYTEVNPALHPLLHVGAQLHIGKATVWGMGRYRLSTY